MFYRPEFISDRELWQRVREGKEISPQEIGREEVDPERERVNKAKRRAEAMKKYR